MAQAGDIFEGLHNVTSAIKQLNNVSCTTNKLSRIGDSIKHVQREVSTALPDEPIYSDFKSSVRALNEWAVSFTSKEMTEVQKQAEKVTRLFDELSKAEVITAQSLVQMLNELERSVELLNHINDKFKELMRLLKDADDSLETLKRKLESDAASLRAEANKTANSGYGVAAKVGIGTAALVALPFWAVAGPAAALAAGAICGTGGFSRYIASKTYTDVDEMRRDAAKLDGYLDVLKDLSHQLNTILNDREIISQANKNTIDALEIAVKEYKRQKETQLELEDLRKKVEQKKCSLM